MIRLWDVETGVCFARYEAIPTISDAALYTPDGQTLITASEDRTIRMWNPKTGEPTKLLFSRYDHNVCSLSLSPDGLMLARGSHNKDIKIWEVTTGTELMTLLGKDQYDHHWSVCVAFSPDGIHLASGNDIGKVKLWEVLPGGEEKLSVKDIGASMMPKMIRRRREASFVEDDGGFQKAMETWIGALTYTPDGNCSSREAAMRPSSFLKCRP